MDYIKVSRAGRTMRLTRNIRKEVYAIYELWYVPAMKRKNCTY